MPQVSLIQISKLLQLSIYNDFFNFKVHPSPSNTMRPGDSLLARFLHLMHEVDLAVVITTRRAAKDAAIIAPGQETYLASIITFAAPQGIINPIFSGRVTQTFELLLDDRLVTVALFGSYQQMYHENIHDGEALTPFDKVPSAPSLRGKAVSIAWRTGRTRSRTRRRCRSCLATAVVAANTT
jgi:hypothetical protein